MNPTILIMLVLAAAPPSSKRRKPTVTEALIATVVNENLPEAERLQATAQLVEQNAPAAIVPLTVERQRATGKLGAALDQALKSLGASAHFTKELKAKEPARRILAAELIGFVPSPEALAIVTAALKDQEAKVREHAASSLGRFSDPKAVGPLGEALKTDKSADVRAAAAQSLATLGGDDAQRLLDEAEKTEQDPFVLRLLKTSR